MQPKTKTTIHPHPQPPTIATTTKTKVDWVQARKDYLADNTLSYADIAKKYDVSKHTVEVHAKRESWVATRQSIGEKSLVKLEGDLVNRNAEVNERHGVAFRNMQQLAGIKLTIAFRQIEKIIADKGLKNMTIYDLKMISQQDIRNLIEAYSAAINGERVTLGLPTSVERKEVTGRDGKELFGDDNYSELVELLANTITALGEGSEPVATPRSNPGRKN
jgi:hypothetical protein